MSFGVHGITYMNPSDQYVYYNRLNSDEFSPEKTAKLRQMYTSAVGRLNLIAGGSSDAESRAKMKEAADFFAQMRNNEYKKEIFVLSKNFGKQMTDVYNDENGDQVGAQLIQLFNDALLLKDVFQQHLDLIRKAADPSAKKQVITYFASYLSTAWNQKWGAEMGNRVSAAIKAAPKNSTETIGQIVERVVTQCLPEFVKDALINAMQHKEEDKVTQGYGTGKDFQELQSAIQDFSNRRTNEFIQRLIEIYKLDEIGSTIAQEIASNMKTNYKKALKGHKIKKDDYDIHVRGGLANEAFGKFVADIVNMSVQEYRGIATGATEQKADMVFTLNIKTRRFEQMLLDAPEKGTKDESIRVENIKRLLKITHELGKLTNGCIMYVNAKNYGLKNKSWKGFSAGSAIKLQTFADMMSTARMSAGDIIFAAMQLPKDAIGENYLQQVRNLYARTIATALFDDVTTLKDTKESPNAIHLLYLNGIYFPMSFYYDLLYRAFNDSAQEQIDKLVDVEINGSGSILYPKRLKEEEKGEGGFERWNDQRQTTLSHTTIQYHFLRNFQEIMKQLNL